MKVLITHPGTQYSHQLVKQLELQGVLYQYRTCFCIPEKSIYGKLANFLPRFIFRKISNRLISGVPKKKIKTYPFLELKTLIQLRRGKNAEAIIQDRNRRFQERIPDKVLLEADLVIGFDTSSWILAERCKKLGKRFILDVSIAHPLSKKKIYHQIASVYPDWSFTLRDKEDKYIRNEQFEMELADSIVVASSFTKNTLTENGVPDNRVYVNPYGVESDAFRPAESKIGKSIKFLFLGLVDARKGVPVLLEVWKALEPSAATLTLVGPVMEETKKYIEHNFENVHIVGKVPFSELKQLLPTYDVLVFPSYFEGFGLVILEAMACGLPVITTTATCGPDVILNGTDGWLIESGDVKSLSVVMSEIIQNSTGLAVMGQLAREKAKQFSWDAYGGRWRDIIEKSLLKDN